MTHLLLLSLLALSPPSHEMAAGPPQEVAVMEQRKLRKLHLVRPDLIPFPITFDVYC